MEAFSRHLSDFLPGLGIAGIAAVHVLSSLAQLGRCENLRQIAEQAVSLLAIGELEHRGRTGASSSGSAVSASPDDEGIHHIDNAACFGFC